MIILRPVCRLQEVVDRPISIGVALKDLCNRPIVLHHDVKVGSTAGTPSLL